MFSVQENGNKTEENRPLGCSREDVALKVSLVGDISSWGVSSYNKRGAVGCGGLPDAHLFGALPHHGREMT